MHFYPLDRFIERTLEQELSREQWLLKQFTGKRFAHGEAEIIWPRILDHKWHISEKLGRDVGLRVAVVDFLDNIYEPRKDSDRASGGFTGFVFGFSEKASMLS